MTGDGHATPVVRRIRLDFPRSTSLEFLPPVYRENPEAEDFTGRFLSLFDASIADLDRAIERAPALLDPSGVPDEVLPWLGGFLDIAFDRAWEPERRRRILKAAPELYRLRGTIAGLIKAVELVFDVTPVIEELPAARSWGALGKQSRLREARLFGKARARFKLGSSALSTAPLRSFGDPDVDPLAAQAHQFRVFAPPGPLITTDGLERLQRLIESLKPAHTVASVRTGGGGFVLGVWASVGVDTVFSSLPPPALGRDGNVRLRRMSVLWPGLRGARKGIILDERSAVGPRTIVE
jgi:phage tail-like protein